MVVRQCVFSNDEPDLHFVEIASCSKDKRIACFLLLRTRQLKIGSIWVKMRSIRGEHFTVILVQVSKGRPSGKVNCHSKNLIGRSYSLKADGFKTVSLNLSHWKAIEKTVFKIIPKSSINCIISHFEKRFHFYTDFTDKSHARMSVQNRNSRWKNALQ